MNSLEKLSFLILHSTNFINKTNSQWSTLLSVADLENLAKQHKIETNIEISSDKKTAFLNKDKLILLDIEFIRVGELSVDIDTNSQPKKRSIQDKRNQQRILCSINKTYIGTIPQKPGVYCWFFDNELVYIGEAENLQRRMKNYANPGNSQYTSLKINQAILEAIITNKEVTFYYYQTNKHKDVENVLLKECFKPRLNKK
ncbi:MAG: GIY-YIG nuclease family protein [Clostridia bacterium]|nr:GIY-YIG nuclease family protein [Clostridia bacterium]